MFLPRVLSSNWCWNNLYKPSSIQLRSYMKAHSTYERKVGRSVIVSLKAGSHHLSSTPWSSFLYIHLVKLMIFVELHLPSRYSLCIFAGTSAERKKESVVFIVRGLSHYGLRGIRSANFSVRWTWLIIEKLHIRFEWVGATEGPCHLSTPLGRGDDRFDRTPVQVF